MVRAVKIIHSHTINMGGGTRSPLRSNMGQLKLSTPGENIHLHAVVDLGR